MSSDLDNTCNSGLIKTVKIEYKKSKRNLTWTIFDQFLTQHDFRTVALSDGVENVLLASCAAFGIDESTASNCKAKS